MNALRAHLYEFGYAVPQGIGHLGRLEEMNRSVHMAQAVDNFDSERRQYDLAEAAGTTGTATVMVIDDDLRRSGPVSEGL